MTAWIFQAIPADYNLPNALRAGDPQVWRVSRYREDIKPGDRLYMWEGGENRGLLAAGWIAGMPCETTLSDRQLRFVVADTLEGKRQKFGKDWYVPVDIDKRLAERIPAGRMSLHPDLKALPILSNARGTNFRVPPLLEQPLERVVDQSLAADTP